MEAFEDRCHIYPTPLSEYEDVVLFELKLSKNISNKIKNIRNKNKARTALTNKRLTAIEKHKVLDSKGQQKEMNMFKNFAQKSKIAVYRKKRDSIKHGVTGVITTRNIR